WRLPGAVSPLLCTPPKLAGVDGNCAEISERLLDRRCSSVVYHTYRRSAALRVGPPADPWPWATPRRRALYTSRTGRVSTGESTLGNRMARALDRAWREAGDKTRTHITVAAAQPRRVPTSTV